MSPTSLRRCSNVLPANKLCNNYVLFSSFFCYKHVTKKGPFYNVISIRYSNVTKCNVILTSQKRKYIEPINNIIVTQKVRHVTKTKRNFNVISIRIVNVPQKSVILTSWKICHGKKCIYNVILT